MAKIQTNKTLTADDMLQQPSPIILCLDRPDYIDAITAANYQKISLNLPLAKALSGLTSGEIPLAIFQKIRNIFPQSTLIYLSDYEMLFDPRYKLDVIRLFTDLSRHYKMIVKWCGTTSDEALIYSEPGYEDHKIYKISNYEITVIA